MNIQEGYMPYLGYQTYYRIAGNLHSGRTPLVLLHGGPGSTHNYFETLDALAEETPLIMYDQLGWAIPGLKVIRNSGSQRPGFMSWKP